MPDPFKRDQQFRLVDTHTRKEVLINTKRTLEDNSVITITDWEPPSRDKRSAGKVYVHFSVDDESFTRSFHPSNLGLTFVKKQIKRQHA